jgi:hypothetical protein
VYEDNDRATTLANNPMGYNTRKHVDSKHHYNRRLVDAKIFAVVSVGWTDMLGDSLMKAVKEPKLTMIFNRCMGAASDEGSF